MARLITTNGVTVHVADAKVDARIASGSYRLADDAGATDDTPKGNASAEEWATYATSRGIEVPEGAKRDEIKAAVLAASESGTQD